MKIKFFYQVSIIALMAANLSSNSVMASAQNEQQDQDNKSTLSSESTEMTNEDKFRVRQQLDKMGRIDVTRVLFRKAAELDDLDNLASDFAKIQKEYPNSITGFNFVKIRVSGFTTNYIKQLLGYNLNLNEVITDYTKIEKEYPNSITDFEFVKMRASGFTTDDIQQFLEWNAKPDEIIKAYDSSKYTVDQIMKMQEDKYKANNSTMTAPAPSQQGKNNKSTSTSELTREQINKVKEQLKKMEIDVNRDLFRKAAELDDLDNLADDFAAVNKVNPRPIKGFDFITARTNGFTTDNIIKLRTWNADITQVNADYDSSKYTVDQIMKMQEDKYKANNSTMTAPAPSQQGQGNKSTSTRKLTDEQTEETEQQFEDIGTSVPTRKMLRKAYLLGNFADDFKKIKRDYPNSKYAQDEHFNDVYISLRFKGFTTDNVRQLLEWNANLSQVEISIKSKTVDEVMNDEKNKHIKYIKQQLQKLNIN